MPFIIISAIVAILVAILAIQNSMMVDLTLFMWSFRLNLVLVVNEQIALLEDDKRILRDKVEQLMKAQGGVMDPADTSTTPAAPVKPDAQKTPGGSFGN